MKMPKMDDFASFDSKMYQKIIEMVQIVISEVEIDVNLKIKASK